MFCIVLVDFQTVGHYWVLIGYFYKGEQNYVFYFKSNQYLG